MSPGIFFISQVHRLFSIRVVSASYLTNLCSGIRVRCLTTSKYHRERILLCNQCCCTFWNYDYSSFKTYEEKFGKLIVAAVIVIIDRQANASALDSRVPVVVLL